MALIDTYRSHKLRKQEEISKLSSDLSKENSKLAGYHKKIVEARQAISRTKILSTIKSKTNDIMRAERSIADINKKVAQIQEKIARKEKELATIEKNYRNEEVKEYKKREALENKSRKDSENQLRALQQNINKQEYQHRLLKKEVEDIKKLPKQITILFMASNAIDNSVLQLDKEAREIQNKIRSSEYRDVIKFETRWAVRTTDILQAINETNPTIIHFSGHGSENGDLVLLNTDETYKFVPKEAITAVISTLSDSVKLVVFNTCFSKAQAINITKNIDVAIGMSTSISDAAACVFSAQLYSSIGFGLSIDKAFKQAIASLLLEDIDEIEVPELFYKEGINMDEMILVSP
ncbi:CHAT domain-containing protein [Exercitatus varius]|uniref:CHAT domain-containing protein n=1 Tax=Exercitatus varius TaxID=67857 RepID=UPI00294AE842|nr:CHAT domain-containing protein [Exercitatus varius]MDG2958080.1 CHAT domain-containing protein [Exercitatus varius]